MKKFFNITRHNNRDEVKRYMLMVGTVHINFRNYLCRYTEERRDVLGCSMNIPEDWRISGTPKIFPCGHSLIINPILGNNQEIHPVSVKITSSQNSVDAIANI